MSSQSSMSYFEIIIMSGFIGLLHLLVRVSDRIVAARTNGVTILRPDWFWMDWVAVGLVILAVVTVVVLARENRKGGRLFHWRAR